MFYEFIKLLKKYLNENGLYTFTFPRYFIGTSIHNVLISFIGELDMSETGG